MGTFDMSRLDKNVVAEATRFRIRFNRTCRRRRSETPVLVQLREGSMEGSPDLPPIDPDADQTEAVAGNAARSGSGGVRFGGVTKSSVISRQ